MLDWSKYIAIAEKFQYKAKRQDRGDLNHNIIVSLADTQTRLDTNGGGQLSELAMLRIASCRVADYWRSEYRNGRIISLNQVVYEDEDGNQIELIDTLADDKAIDLEAWLDRSVWELGFPKRLVEIVRKRLYGIPLNGRDQRYWHRYNQKDLKKYQKSLFDV